VPGEAKLEQGPGGLAPAGDGWFVVNVRDATWNDAVFGAHCAFETPAQRFRDVALNISVLQPGQPNCYYHSEQVDEHFLVLAGECLLFVDDEERRLGPWDFVHCPPGVEHVFVGAGDGPCAILMVGGRPERDELLYPRSELALRHRAGVEVETTDPERAYAGIDPPAPGRPAGWDLLPWA
jgi:uncharacterized cupin superfamily protein